MKTLIKHFLLIYISFISANIVLSNPINPFINSVSPSMNAVSVNKSSNITIVFTEDMNAASVNGANIKVFGYQTGLLPVTIDYNPISKTANINPNQDLRSGEKISITLTPNLKTASNENITPFVFSFIVKAVGGNGYFTKTSSIAISDRYYIESGDINRDGNIDLIINNKIYKNTGNAVFTFLSELGINGFPELADFDSDGDLDILIQRNDSIFFYQNNGSGSYTQTYFFNGLLESYGDLNGDGFLDIIAFSEYNNFSISMNNNGNFLNDSLIHVTGGCNGGRRAYLLVDDYNNDGKTDAVGIHGFIGGGIGPIPFILCRTFKMLKNLGEGAYSINQIYTEQVEGSSILLSCDGSNSFDYDGDGFIDIVSPGIKLRNIGNETFSYLSGFSPFSVSQSSDFNGDGSMDLVSSLNYFSIVPLWTNTNDGTGNFTQFTSNNGKFITLTSGDFDNDGDIDIAGFDNSIHEISILLNGDVPLPAELTSFTSQVNVNSVNLNWSTSSEENNSGFDIERSKVIDQTSDGWNKISFIQGHGTTATQNNYEFTDRNLNSGKYKYRLKQIDFNGNFKYFDLANEVVIGSPEKFELSQNYPNPFNPVTHLGFGISNLGFVSLKVYDVIGKEITTLINEIKPAGYYEIEFNGSGLPSGIYYYKLEAGSFSQVKKMMIVK